MDLNLLGKDFYPGREEDWPQGFPPEEVQRMLGRKIETENVGRREARQAEVVRPASCSCKPKGGRKAPASIPCPKPEGTGGCKERG